MSRKPPKPLTRELIGEFIDAACDDHQEADRLLRKRPDLLEAPSFAEETPLHFLAVEGFDRGVAYLIGKGANVNARNRLGWTVLGECVVLGRKRRGIIEMLIEAGANPELPNGDDGIF